MVQIFYISKNKSRNQSSSEIYKYGIFHNERYERILDNRDQFPDLSEYVNLYGITTREDYKLYNIKEYDKIISKRCRKTYKIEHMEKIYNCELPYMRKIKDYLLNGDKCLGGKELIKYKGIEELKKIIEWEFEKIGLDIIKFSNSKVDEINQSIKINKKKEIKDEEEKDDKLEQEEYDHNRLDMICNKNHEPVP